MKKTIGNELKAILKKKGYLTPEIIVETARSKSSALHGSFIWDDAVAAQEHRLEQARKLILASRMVVVLQEDRRKSPEMSGKIYQVRQFLQPAMGDGVYLARSDVLDNRSYRKDFVERKKKELRSWCVSVADVKELSMLREAIEKLL